MWFWNLLDHSPTWPESETHMILQLQAKVHGLGNLAVLTYTYQIFSWFETPKSDPSLPHDDWLAGWLTDSLADWLAGWLARWFTDSLAGWLANWLTGWPWFALTVCLICSIRSSYEPRTRLILKFGQTQTHDIFNLQGNPCLNWSWAWFFWRPLQEGNFEIFLETLQLIEFRIPYDFAIAS